MGHHLTLNTVPRPLPPGWLGVISRISGVVEGDAEQYALSAAAKQDFAEEGQVCDQLHVLVSGWGARFLTAPSGVRQLVTVGLPGDLLDLDRLYRAGSCYGLTALTDCRYVEVDRRRLHEAARDDPELAQALGAQLAADNARLVEGSTRFGLRNAPERLAHFLCEMIVRLRCIEADEEGLRFPITQEQLAAILGLSAVHVNRTLQDLRAAELVEWRCQRLKILDWDRLSRLAAFDPAYLDAPVPAFSAAPANGSGETAASDRATRRELRHRFKNLVAVTQSLVRQTLADGANLADARDVLMARLGAMGRSIDALEPADWRHGSLREIVHGTLEVTEGDERLRCQGPDLQLRGRPLLGIAMALHELRTNAIKYGALSNGTGKVRVFWKIVEGAGQVKLWMQWSEVDGPPIEAPQRTGFGARLLSDVTAQALSGEVFLDHSAGGLTWLLVAPLDVNSIR